VLAPQSGSLALSQLNLKRRPSIRRHPASVDHAVTPRDDAPLLGRSAAR
jgi:hypothetical protein